MRKDIKDQYLKEHFLILGIFLMENFIEIIVGSHAVVRNNASRSIYIGEINEDHPNENR